MHVCAQGFLVVVVGCVYGAVVCVCVCLGNAVSVSVSVCVCACAR